MSVYIKGMEMPKSCCECFAFKSNASGQLFCKAKRIAFGKEDAEWLPKRTPNWCPLVELPPHGRLIDRDAFLEDMNCNLWDWSTVDGITATTALKQTMSDLRNAPTVLEAEG